MRWKAFEKSLGARLRPFDASRRLTFWRKFDHFVDSVPDAPLWLLRTVASVIPLGAVVLGCNTMALHAATWMAGLGLWVLIVAIFSADFASNPAQAPADNVLWVLPLSAERIHRCLLGRFFRGSSWVGFECLLVFGTLAAVSHASARAWLAAPLCAAMATAIYLAGTPWLAGSRIRPLWVFIGLEAAIVSFTLLAASESHGHAVPDIFCLANPFAWANAIFLQSCVRGHIQFGWLMVPTLALLSAAPWTLRSLRRIHLKGFKQPARARDPREMYFWKNEPAPLKASPSDARREILRGGFLQPEWEISGLVERLLARFLSKRDRAVADALFSDGPRQSRFFLWLLVWMALYVAAGSLKTPSLETFGEAYPAGGYRWVPYWIIGTAICAMLAATSGLMLMMWPCLATFEVERSNVAPPRALSPYHAFRMLSASYWETVRVVAGVASLLGLLLVPLAVIFSRSSAWQRFADFVGCPRSAAIKCLLLVWSATLVLASFRLLSFGAHLRLKYWRSILKTAVAVTGIGCLGVALGQSPTWMQAWLSGTLLVIATLGWLAYCGKRYRAGLAI